MYIKCMYVHIYADVHITCIKINILSRVYTYVYKVCLQNASGNGNGVSEQLNDGSFHTIVYFS